jgi:hypothetical protein
MLEAHCPGVHVAHAVDPVDDWLKPALQLIHVGADAIEYVPTLHALQKAEEFAPLNSEYVPAAQPSQVEAPDDDENFPAGQKEHVEDDVVENFPAGQVSHKADPSEVANVPAEHKAQRIDPKVEYVPAEHSTQFLFPEFGWKFPAGQRVQLEEAQFFAYDPAAQDRHFGISDPDAENEEITLIEVRSLKSTFE